MWRLILKSGIMLLCLYGIALLALFLLQRKFMYIPPSDYVGPDDLSPAMQEVVVTTPLGDKVTAWWHAPDNDAPIVMFFHGNGSGVYYGHEIYNDLIGAGFGVLGASYPGYPGASGKPTQEAIVSAAEAQFDFVREQNGTSEIYVYGTSLGAGVSSQLASSRDVSRLVLEAPFYSMEDMAARRMPIFAFSSLVRDKYRSHEALEGLDIPVLWLHGTKDRVVPIRQGQKLYDSYDGPKFKLIVNNGSHVDVWGKGGRKRIIGFLKR